MPLNLGKNRLIQTHPRLTQYIPGSFTTTGSSGSAGAIQLSSGQGGPLTNNSNIFVAIESSGSTQLNRLVLDATNTNQFGEALTRLRFIKPANPQTGSSLPPSDGDIAYWDDSGGSGTDLRLYKDGQGWISLTTASGASSVAALPNKGIQFCAPTGTTNPPLNASANFTFDTTGTPNVFSVIGKTICTGDVELISDQPSGGLIKIRAKNTTTPTNVSTIDVTSGAVEVTTSSTINLQSNGNISATSATAGIALKATAAGQTITNTTGNLVTELKDNSSNGEFLTISSNYAGGTNPDLGIRLKDEPTYNQGAGASLFLAGTSGLTTRQATMELNTLNGTSSLTRVFLQSQAGSSSGASGGGYRVLFASGSAPSSAPIPGDLGGGQILQNGQFWIGEARTGTRPHVNYNLSSFTPGGQQGFGTFNFAETRLNITNSLETILYGSFSKGTDSGTVYGGNLSLYPSSGNSAKIQLRGDGLATFGAGVTTDLIRLDGTATGSSAGGLITLENHSYQSFGNPLANPIKLDATGTNPVVTIGTNGTGGPLSGKLIVTDGINASIVADGGPNSGSTFDGKLTIGASNSETIILGGKNSFSTGLRSIDADGSLIANGIGHISYGTWSGQSYEDRADLCLGGTPGVIPDAGQPTGVQNNPNFMIRTQKKGTTTETYPALILNRYLGPASSTVDDRKLQGVMLLDRTTGGGTTYKNRVCIATGDPYDLNPPYMMNLVCKKPSASSSTILPQGATINNFPITTPRDPDDGICFNGDIVINRTRGITIDAFDYTGTSWSGAQGPLFIGKVNNLSGLKSNTIASTYTVGVEIGADFGGSTPSGNNNTGCIVNGDIRVGNATSMNVVHGGTTHTGYVGDGGLFAFNETGLRGSSVYTNLIGVGGTKMYIAKNLSAGADNTAVIGSCIEGPQGVVMLRGQVELTAFNAEIDLDTCQVGGGGGTLIIPHNNPDVALPISGWPVGTFAAMFQNPMVSVTNAGFRDPPGAIVSQSDAAQGATVSISLDPLFTQVQAIIKIDITVSPPTSKLFISANPAAGTPNLVVNYIVYCERKDEGYQPVPGGYLGFTKPYVNPVTGTTFTFSGAATTAEINANGGESGFGL